MSDAFNSASAPLWEPSRGLLRDRRDPIIVRPDDRAGAPRAYPENVLLEQVFHYVADKHQLHAELGRSRRAMRAARKALKLCSGENRPAFP
ncbi:MAG: hypothetical protein OER95_16540 [Acidimicrobiia bacterium]|nr:hypothetical protein [Acidimicrobiia bacterium]